MDQLDNEFMEYLGNMGKGFGMHDLVLKIWAVIYLQPEEISMDDISEKTGYSLASICNTMKMLESLGAVKRIRKPKTKKIFFYMDKDLMKWNIKKLDFFVANIIRPAKDKLPDVIKRYKDKVKTAQDKKKLRIVENYFNQVLLFEEIINIWKKDMQLIMSKHKKEVNI